MRPFLLPELLLSLPTLLQAGFTFWRLRSHGSGYLWQVFWLALAGQLLASVGATWVAMRGLAAQGLPCLTGAVSLLAGGLGLAVVAVPGVALLAVAIRDARSPAEPLPPRVGL